MQLASARRHSKKCATRKRWPISRVVCGRPREGGIARDRPQSTDSSTVGYATRGFSVGGIQRWPMSR
eukprot:11263503-Alexandrium_andersonii.AAC.1